MVLPESGGPLIYLAIAFAAVVEGEITFAAAATLVGRGVLDPIAVVAAGAAGAAIGDQAYFYLLRGRLHGRLSSERIDALTAGWRS